MTAYSATEEPRSIIVKRLANDLERFYAAPLPLTLAKLRSALMAIEQLQTTNGSSAPSVSDVWKPLHNLGLGDLPLDSVNRLIEAVASANSRGNAREISLKQLEELMTTLQAK